MSGRSLSAVLLYLLYSPTLALLPPELVITEHLITETDSVTLHCRTPSGQTVHQCFVYSVETKNSVSFSCMKTLTATELLIHSNQSAPAVVQVRCFYTVKYGDIKSPSPHSGISFITIQNVMRSKSTPSAFTPPPCPCHSAGWTLTNNDGVFTSTLNPGGAASGGSDEKNKDKATGMWILTLIIAVACFGVIVGVISLGLMLWRTDSERRKRQKDETEVEYHMYCTMTDDLTPPVKTDIVYRKVERH
ncbi:uncharacterized protein isoform X1 [Takifugu rubripes]|uniref:uncharacterized protein isoform X1 n=1 Tax=Takifugu rubripes TaxID=31033 RepID=UPI001145E877|nr:uncharacterized protein LOC115246845 isoform X1 [Takifugu rubripes]